MIPHARSGTPLQGRAGIRTVVQWSRTSRGGRQYEFAFDSISGESEPGGGPPRAGCTSDMALCEQADPSPAAPARHCPEQPHVQQEIPQ